ncbi:hypothetical protein K504DRAFT_297228 [Pleomassaria siparia CBS 279.74]|uniref:Uncharacterized protein n=1 Tax=Pleomassaria siparia CBS 279.74 TaxID=1314801 RepID=A0A6G1K5J1_9PLEO|nr:hypothetical protein K504DRAFT_297228 [Pleomassaria siparia CBS 279.74]
MISQLRPSALAKRAALINCFTMATRFIIVFHVLFSPSHTLFFFLSFFSFHRESASFPTITQSQSSTVFCHFSSPQALSQISQQRSLQPWSNMLTLRPRSCFTPGDC